MFLKRIKFALELIGFRIIFAVFRVLPLGAASSLGGALARLIGRFLSANKTAYLNLKTAFPEKSEADIRMICARMWDNLGRVAAELSHLDKPDIEDSINITGGENMPAHDIPAFLFSGHIGNWEMLAVVASKCGRPVTGIYREANNKAVDAIISDLRSSRYFGLIPKGRQGATKIARAIKNNEALAMLIDQKLTDGIPVPFFGRDAMTAPAIAELALRYDMPIIPARVIRTGGAKFEGIVYPPLAYQKTGEKEQDVKNIMLAINQTLEGWIREYPEQWFWVHKRWGKFPLEKR